MLRFLGCGSAFNPALGNTCAYLEKGEHLILIDCGELIFAELYQRGLLERYEKISVFITHMHADHVGSLGSLLSYSYYVMGKRVEVIYPDEAIQRMLDLTGIDRESYYFLNSMEAEFDGVKAQAIPVKHAEDMKCFGYLLADGERTIYYSGDCYEIPADILQGFLVGEIENMFQDTTDKASAKPSHMPLTELAEKIPAKMRGRVYCMHFTRDFSEKIAELGFRSAVELIEQFASH